MKRRGDVYSLAEKLAAVSGITADHVYRWLMKLGKAKSRNPACLNVRAVFGRVYLHGDDEAWRIEKLRPARVECGRIPMNIRMPDFEGMILERQELRDIAEDM